MIFTAVNILQDGIWLVRYLIKKIDPQLTNNEPEIAENKSVTSNNAPSTSKYLPDTSEDILSPLKERPSSFMDLSSTSDELSEVVHSTNEICLPETKTTRDNSNNNNFFPDQSQQNLTIMGNMNQGSISVSDRAYVNKPSVNNFYVSSSKDFHDLNENLNKNDFDIDDIKKSAINNIRVFKFPFGGNWNVFESTYSIVPEIKKGDDKFVQLEELLGIDESTFIVDNKYVTISGEGGSGKSFLSRIMAKKYFLANLYCFLIDLTVVELHEECIFSRFLLENSCTDIFLDDTVLKGFTKWLIENQHRTVVILDGLDRLANQELPENFKATLDRVQTSKQWISAILSRKVLSDCKVILTSRPFAICNLDGDFTANYNYTLEGLKIESVESALQLFVEKEEDKETARECFKVIKEKRLLNLATSPNNVFLLFQIVESGLDLDSEDITTASLYNKVFNNVFHTKSYSHKVPTEENMVKLEKICFELTCKRKFVIEEDDLGDDLSFENLNKLIPTEAKIKNKSFYSVNREKSIQISHQFGQEMLASRFIFYQMSYNEFNKFLEEQLFSNINETVSYFSEVRRFLYHFLCLYSKNQNNYSRNYKRKLAITMNETNFEEKKFILFNLLSKRLKTELIEFGEIEFSILADLEKKRPSFFFFFQLIEDFYEIKTINNDLGIKNPYKIVEILDQFGLNCLDKYTWFVKTSFTEIEELYVVLKNGKNVSEVLSSLTNLKKIDCLTLDLHKTNLECNLLEETQPFFKNVVERIKIKLPDCFNSLDVENFRIKAACELENDTNSVKLVLFKHKEMYDLVPNPKIYGKEENRTKLISYTEKMNGDIFLNFYIRNCNKDVLKNSVEDINNKTLAGEKTMIEVRSVEEAKNLKFLCQNNLDLYQVNFFMYDTENYDEFIEVLLQTVELENLKIRFMELWHIKYDDIRRVIEVMENFEVVTFYCNETLNENQLSFLESSELKEIIEESEAAYVVIFTNLCMLKYFYGIIVEESTGFMQMYKEQDI